MLQSDSRSAASPTKALREQFIGTWKLVSIESEESRLFGDRPVGILIYDADGNVAVQIMRNPRPSLAARPGVSARQGSASRLQRLLRVLRHLGSERAAGNYRPSPRGQLAPRRCGQGFCARLQIHRKPARAHAGRGSSRQQFLPDLGTRQVSIFSIRQELLECGGSATAFPHPALPPQKSTRSVAANRPQPLTRTWPSSRGAQRRRISLRFQNCPRLAEP